MSVVFQPVIHEAKMLVINHAIWWLVW